MEDDAEDRWKSFTGYTFEPRDLAAFGALTISTQELDAWVGWSIAILLGSYQDSFALTARLNFRTKIDIMAGLVENRTEPGDKWRVLWSELEQRIRDVSEERNHYVHSLWEHDEDTGVLKAWKPRSKGAPAIKEPDRDGLYALAREAEILTNEVSAFVQDLRQALPSRSE